MDTKELQARRTKLERDIAKSVDVLVAEFEDESNSEVSCVTIGIFRKYPLQDKHTTIHRCKVDLKDSDLDI